MRLTEFKGSEDGAIAVDWVVLTGALVGLGIATLVLVSGGVEDLSRDVDGSLRGQGIGAWFSGSIPLLSMTFTDGELGSWVGGRVMDMGGDLGELLVLGAREAAALRIQVPDGMEQVVMSFDLIAGDSLDVSDRWGTDTATILLNGVPVVIAESGGTEMTFDIPQADGTTVEATVTVSEQHMGGSGQWTDSAARVTITVDDPAAEIDLRMQSSSNQSIGDEFWGLDNFSAEAN